MTPSFSEAKRLTAKLSATWNEASSAAGSSASAASAEAPSTKLQAPRKPQLFFIRASGQFIGQLSDLAFFGLDQRHEFLHFRREPANGRIAIIAAARLLGPIAAEKGPILRTPVIEPEPVLRHNHLTETLERSVRPNPLLVSSARSVRHVLEAKLPRECARQVRLAARRELKAVVGEARLTMGHAAKFGEQVHQRQVALTRQVADGVRVFGQVRVACRKVRQPSTAFFEGRRRQQREPR